MRAVNFINVSLTEKFRISRIHLFCTAGVEETSEEVASIENGGQIRDLFRRTREDDMDFERPQQNDGSALASNCTHPGGVSPIVSRPSRSNSSSPLAMYDNYFASRNGDRVSFEQNSIVGNFRASSIPSINPVVDLTSDGSDEEESELREIGGLSRLKRKLPEWGGERKRPRESADRSDFQPGHPFARFAHGAANSRSWDPSPLRHNSAMGNLESSVTSASSLRQVMSGSDVQRKVSEYDTYWSKAFSMTQRNSSGVSTSLDRSTGRVLPGSMGSSYAVLANGMRTAAAVDQRMHAVMDPVKRSEELATQAVFQVLIPFCTNMIFHSGSGQGALSLPWDI